jgi:HptB-dependent secretion and biofilm anti anti-sigma factor
MKEKDEENKLKIYIDDDKRIVIEFQDIFTFTVHRQFMNILKMYPSGNKYIINLSKVSRMDSAALGMLLVLREHNKCGHKDDIRIISNPETEKVLEIANFGLLFKID